MGTPLATLILRDIDANDNHQWKMESWKAGFQDVVLRDVRSMELGRKHMYIGWSLVEGEKVNWVIKIRFGEEGNARLKREADVYMRDLEAYQNVLVPVCLGLRL